MTKWSRKRIIESILEREKDGMPLHPGGNDRIDSALYQAGTRIFGSWANAVEAAGVPSDRIHAREPWTPGQIRKAIRTLARRKRPPSVTELRTRNPTLVAAARRAFGSWSKAVIAAGCDPTRFHRVLPWTTERILEAILIRAIRSEPLSAQSTQPRSLVEAAQRVFGSWDAAKEAAGLDLEQQRLVSAPARTPVQREEHRPWTDADILEGIHNRFKDRKRVNASAVRRDNKALYAAARRRFGSWRNALRAAGFRRVGPLGLTSNPE